MKFVTFFLLPNMIACFLSLSIENNQGTSNYNEKGMKYFASPSIAVKQITAMLKEKDWTELSKYYDLTGSTVKRADLISGNFFYTEVRPEVVHPAGFWKYKQPFPPGFSFRTTRDTNEKNVIEVTVGIEIDQGGGMIQRGEQTFLMRKSKKGYQVLTRREPKQ